MFSLDDRDDDAPPSPLAPEIDALARFAVELDGRIVAEGIEGLSSAVELQRRMLAALDGITTVDLERMIARVATLSQELARAAEHLRALRACKDALARVIEPDATATNSVNRPIR